MKNPERSIQRMSIWGMAISFIALALLGSAPGFSQSEGHGQVVVTLLPKQGVAAPLNLTAKDLPVTVNGKPATVTDWKPLHGPEDKLELVLLIDGGARGSLGSQFSDIEDFVKTLPANTSSAFAYMQNGQAAFAGPLSTDHAKVLQGLHLPGGSAGSSASPYFCLSDLAQHWPSDDLHARREVLLITDGVDPYNPRYDPENPYLLAAIADSARAGVVVDALYWQTKASASSTNYQNNAGQNMLQEVVQATGGKSFWIGMGNPVSFQPFLKELGRRLQNQYELSFTVELNGKAEVKTLKLKLKLPNTEVSYPQQVLVSPR